MRPIAFVKQHPVAVFGNMALGMMIGPWILRQISDKTGVGVSLPSYGG